MNTRLSRTILIILLIFYGVYSMITYTIGTKASGKSFELSAKAVNGKLLWQRYNCNACHQLYGLGGYLGSDLTNINSEEGKGELYIKAFMNSGIKQMPRFNLSDAELDEITEFLKYIDKSGKFPNKDVEMTWYGSIILNHDTE